MQLSLVTQHFLLPLTIWGYIWAVFTSALQDFSWMGTFYTQDRQLQMTAIWQVFFFYVDEKNEQLQQIRKSDTVLYIFKWKCIA